MPYIIKSEHKHLQYRDLTSFNTTYFEQINLDHTILVEHSETSDNRLFITSNISPETTPEEQTSNVELPYTRQHSVQSEQEDLANFFQNPEPHQLHPLYPPLKQVSDIKQANPSETATIQNASEFSEETIQNTQSFTITNDSYFIQVPTHNITQDEINNQNKDKTLSTTQDNTSVLSTSHLILHNHLRHKHHLVKIMTHLLFHLNAQLKFTLIFFLNKALQIHNIIHNTLIQSIFKHQPHHHLLKYKLQLILQLQLIQYKMYKLV